MIRNRMTTAQQIAAAFLLAAPLVWGLAGCKKSESPVAGSAPGTKGPGPASSAAVPAPAPGAAEPFLVAARQGEKSRLQSPRGLTVDPSGNVFVADTGNFRVVKFDSTGREVAIIGRKGSGTGEFESAWLPRVDGKGQLYVLDPRRGHVSVFGTDGKYLRKIGDRASFYSPAGLAVAKDGTVAVADTGGNRVVVFGPDGQMRGEPIASTPQGQLIQPTDAAFDAKGNLYVIQPTGPNGKGTLYRFDPDGKYQTAWVITAVPSTTDTPRLALGPDGRVYLSDLEQGRLVVYDPDGKKASPLALAAGDMERFRRLGDIAVDEKGRIFVIDVDAALVYRLEKQEAAPAQPQKAAAAEAPPKPKKK
ncbi:MAG: NHL repeat-containing protein [Thermoanaerobaculia bacterium]|nr:NHL repeat-containing protein [Thermoanaerobaculia bacterium]